MSEAGRPRGLPTNGWIFMERSAPKRQALEEELAAREDDLERSDLGIDQTRIWLVKKNRDPSNTIVDYTILHY